MFILNKNLNIENEVKDISKLKSYNITYNLNAQGVQGEFKKQTIRQGDKLYTKQPTKEGYVFKGWNEKQDGSGTNYKAGEEYKGRNDQITEITLYAIWEGAPYKLIFNANGGTVTEENRGVKYNESYGKYGLLPNAVKTGYEFLGWFTQVSGGTQITQDTIHDITENRTVYAHWQIPLATKAITASNYGDYVNYSANGVTSWRIFLNDGTNIYLISTDCVPISGMKPGINMTGTYVIYSSSNSALLNYLKNTSIWSAYANGFSGAVATGTPTLDQFWQSYNRKYATNYSGEKDLSNHEGHNNTLYFKSYWNGLDGYWLATERNILGIYATRGGNNIGYNGSGSQNYGVRPLVCLPSGIYGLKGTDNKWTFSK